MQKLIDDVVNLMCSVEVDGEPISSDEAVRTKFGLMNKEALRYIAIQHFGRHVANQAEMHPDYLEWMAQKGDK